MGEIIFDRKVCTIIRISLQQNSDYVQVKEFVGRSEWSECPVTECGHSEQVPLMYGQNNYSGWIANTYKIGWSWMHLINFKVSLKLRSNVSRGASNKQNKETKQTIRLIMFFEACSLNIKTLICQSSKQMSVCDTMQTYVNIWH